MTYTLKYGHETELPEMDAFMSDFRALCERHGFGLDVEIERFGDDCETNVVLVPSDRINWDVFTRDIGESDRGIPWLDAAVAEARRARDKEWADVNRACVEREAARKLAVERDLIENGVRLQDGVYRLVKDE